jgi:hypothetical protein
MFSLLFSILQYLDTKDKEMGDVFHNVGREVGFDEVIATETASITIGIEPIRAIKDERNEFSFLDRRSEFKGTRIIHVPLFFWMMRIAYRPKIESTGETTVFSEFKNISGY